MGTTVLTMLQPLWQGFPSADPLAVSGSVSYSLAPRYESVRGARQFTRETLHRWELEDIFDGVALVVSELVTNALRHTAAVGGGACETSHDASALPARLHLMRWSSRLVCAVRDSSDATPEAGEAEAGAESGRGLYLVDAFSDGWGWHPLANAPHGKIVWAQFRLP
ncbi:ATP-binding protein [Streptomyces sp. WAC 06783]|uniref:ATP-binding protein n=1 Tax=Streptomyces TaxID=1883 RepID=UPI0004C0A4CD|nr:MULTISPECIES: ATP-binding protein [Streptomyces]RSO08182.1 ATP-binding protein [Streptomyces sp. WAC 06783]